MTEFEQACLVTAIDRLPPFDGAWPIERVHWWFDTFFALLERCADVARQAS